MRTAIIIGAGPAGLTAAYEFLEHTDIIPIILEATPDIGGLSKTVKYNGNRLDMGPHRFFSKSDRVMNWWFNILPVDSNEEDITITYHNKQTTVHNTARHPQNPDDVMVVCNRLTRIYFLGKLFSYPVKLNKETIQNLGFIRITRIGFSYMKSKIFPRKPETTLEDFFINRFGKELYLTFFKDYTEKVWGTPTSQISAAWGAQRVKGLSLTKTILHFFKTKKKKADIQQKDTETSLIEKFLYPKYGPGQMWEAVAKRIEAKGGKILLNHEVKKITNKNNRIESVIAVNKTTGEEINFTGDYFISTMPIKDLVNGFVFPADERAKNIAANLIYRDFIAVGLLLKDLKLKNKDGSAVKDNWLYIQEKEVKVGRLQIYNNWSPRMIKDSNTYWLGLEYFCNEGDELWSMDDAAMINFAKKELAAINIIEEDKVLDATVVKVPKTYPSYVGVYDQFAEVQNYMDSFTNLFLIGRNGMHKYNNQDHSMLTAMQAVENIKKGSTDKSNIWSINTEEEYHESK